jgi:hypothetical protein
MRTSRAFRYFRPSNAKTATPIFDLRRHRRVEHVSESRLHEAEARILPETLLFALSFEI